MFSVVMHLPLCHRQMSQKWRRTDQMEGATSRWKVERSAVHHPVCVCGEVAQEPLQAVRTHREVAWVERWSADFSGGQGASRRSEAAERRSEPVSSPVLEGPGDNSDPEPRERWRLWVSGRKFYLGEVTDTKTATWRASNATATWRSEVRIVCQELDRPM